MPDEEDINKVIDACMESANQGRSNFPGMSYEEGVRAGIEWMLGQTDESPLSE